MIAGEIRNIDSSDLSPDSTRRRDFSWRARLAAVTGSRRIVVVVRFLMFYL
jgi:hypothetical protein